LLCWNQTLREEGRPWRNFANIPASPFVADRAAIIARATALHTGQAQAAAAQAQPAAGAGAAVALVVMASLAVAPAPGVGSAANPVLAQLIQAAAVVPDPAAAAAPPIVAGPGPAPPLVAQAAAPPGPLVLQQADDEEEDALDVSVAIDTGYDFGFFEVGDLVLGWRGRNPAGAHVFLPATVRNVDENHGTLTLRFDGDLYNIAHYKPEYCKPRDDDHHNYDVIDS